MSTKTPCNCSSHHTAPTTNERPRYYARQLVTPDDMTLEQDYFRAKMRRHNRFLHGWGIVCGARLVVSNQPWKIIVKSGYILGPFGDEIYIESDQCVDVRNSCTPAPPSTHDCEEATPPARSDATMHVAVEYVETQTRLIRVPLGGCGCEEKVCEYSRIRDAYRICILDHCPHPSDPPSINLGEGPPPDCLPCPSEPWVSLGSFTVDANGTVTIQECRCRRQALGFGSFWWACQVVAPPPPPPTNDPVRDNPPIR